MALHNQLGAAGEQAARDFLIQKGYTIRETNWRMQHLEIDIVAEEPSKCLHIVEVKTRKSAIIDPMRAITMSKKRNLVAAANAYVRYMRLPLPVKFDVMILIGNEQHFDIHYIPNAFYPPVKTYR